jgi:metal-responsive CopG/Arc/MetJ family transcriptional regulator
MEHITFSVRLPKPLVDALDKESRQRYRRGNSRNLLVNDIIANYYEHAPPTPAHTISKSPIAKQNGRKTKAEIS